MKIHELKLDTEFFDDVKSGKKNFEIRKKDRDFKIGDILKLHMFHSECGIEGYAKVLFVDENTKIKNITRVSQEASDTIKVKVTGIWTLDNMFTENGYVDDIEDSINLDMYEKILDDYFKSDILPLGYVVMAIEVCHENI